MTQQLTREQLEFARSIGAVFCVDRDIKPDTDLINGLFGKPGFVYRDGWVEWVDGIHDISDTVSDPSSRFEIDFSPLEYTPKVGEECLGCWSSDPEVYYKVKIICTDGDSIIFRWLEGEHKGCLGEDEQAIFAGCIGFKPLPTEEKAGREKTIKHMVSLNAAHQWTPQEFAEALYDAGYRLQESE